MTAVEVCAIITAVGAAIAVVIIAWRKRNGGNSRGGGPQ